MKPSRSSIVFALALLFACQPDNGGLDLGSDNASEPAETVPEHMQKHFVEAVAIREAIIGGDLFGVRKPGTWLTEHPAVSRMPSDWVPYVVNLRAAARLVATARNLDEAASAMGSLTLSCGRCHLALDATPTFERPPTPAASDEARGRMQRHSWAAARLWEGVVIPSDKSWNLGAAVLSDAPMSPSKVAGDGPIDPKLADLTLAVHQLGTQASAEKDLVARGALFGALLATCADCHRLTNAPVARRRNQ
jgi:cytochrome c553